MTTAEVESIYRHLLGSGKIKTKTDFGNQLGVTRSYASQLISGTQQPPADFEERIIKAFPGIDLQVIYSGTETTNRPLQYLGSISKLTDIRRPYTNQYGVRFDPTHNGKWRMTNKQVPFAAHAAYKGGWGDPEWLGSLPEHIMIVDKPNEDNVITFPIIGDCQNDGTRESLYEGEAITGQSVSRSMWQYTLPFRSPLDKPMKVKKGTEELDVPESSPRHLYWIFLDFKEGLQIGMITKHDTEKGIVYCTCRNPDKEKHPDFQIRIDDCAQIFFGIAVERKL